MIYIIGCGGVGSWLSEAMARLCQDPKKHLVLVDGDKLEQKNLDRQLFSEDVIGRNKAEALGEKLGCVGEGEWFTPYLFPHNVSDWLMVCVDNNPARRAALMACDMFGCKAIIAANEVHSSEAYIYCPDWRGHPTLDPRVTYSPEIEADHSGNPEAASIGCTGEAQVANRQLVTANFMAAALAAHLFVVWAMESRKVKPETLKHLPFRLSQNLTRNGYVLRGDLNQEPTTKEENNE